MKLTSCQTILFPSDLSEVSRHSFEQLLSLMEGRASTVHVLHCYRLIGQTSDSMLLKQELEAKAQAVFGGWLAGLPRAMEADVRFESVPGFFKNRVQAGIQKYGADLLVLDNHLLPEFGSTDRDALDALETLSCTTLMLPFSDQPQSLRIAR